MGGADGFGYFDLRCGRCDCYGQCHPGKSNRADGAFFGLCFLSIGLITNVRKLWAEGLGRIVGVYAIALFGFILWVDLGISYLFYHGILPPVVGS